MAASSGATRCDEAMLISRFRRWWWLGRRQVRLDGLEDRLFAHRRAERPVGRRALEPALAAEAAPDELVQRRRVARLDGVDRQRRGEDVLVRDVAGLAEVCGRAKVLDVGGSLEDRLRAHLDRRPEVRLRGLRGRAPELRD